MGALEIVFITSIIILCAFTLERLLPRHDPREPPKRSTGVPLVGNLLGMLKHGHKYHEIVGGKNPPPAYTLDLLITKSYIVTSIKLMQAVQRNAKFLSFEPLITSSWSRLAGVRGHGLDLLKETENGGRGLGKVIDHAMLPTLMGPGLDRMNQMMINYLKVSVDDLSSNTEPFDLFMWCRHTITIASTDASFGPQNPFRDPEIEEAFWDWEANSAVMMADICPSITASKPYYAREKVVRALKSYFDNDGHNTASDLIKARKNAMIEGGLGPEDISRGQAAMAFGLLTNSVPSTFFMLFEIYSRPKLLAELREELNTFAVKSENKNGSARYMIDLAAIRENCHHFVSTFQEMLRLRMQSATTRLVLKDLLLDDQYLFKKGSMVQMPALYYNRSEGIWGEDVLKFDSKRFLVKDTGSNKTKGFLTFGISPHICPGRHFASGEIVSLVAMLILRFNITPKANAWVEPKINSSALTASVPPLKDPFLVTVSTREEFKDTTWDFHVTEGKGKFNLIIG